MRHDPRELTAIGRAVRMRFRDNLMTFDQAGVTMDHSPTWRGGAQYAIAAGMPLHYGAAGSARGVQTHDGRTVDSTGAFLVGELERLDLTLHEPLASVTWGRDIDLREDVTIADEVSSFTLSTYGSAGSLGGNAVGTGKAWIGKATDQVTGVSVDIAKIPHPLTPWAIELKYTILELESAAKLGRPIDQQKYDGMQLKHQMDTDEQVYIGDTTLGLTGLVNNTTEVGAATSVLAGAGGGTQWVGKTPDEILNDMNTALTTTWQNSAWAIAPSNVLLPPAQYGQIATQKVSLAGNVAVLTYLQENNVFTKATGRKLSILPLKWLLGAGGVSPSYGTAGGTDRMVVYTKDYKRVRFPMTLLQRTPIQYDSIYHKSTYFCRLGAVEVVYGETVSYWDGI
jgi:hypothetical protein